MTAIDFLVEELKKRSIDLTLWHNDLVEQAKEIFEQQIESDCQCFRLGKGSPWQTYLCEIHKEK